MQKSDPLPDCPHCGSPRTRSRYAKDDDGQRWYCFDCARCRYRMRERAPQSS